MHVLVQNGAGEELVQQRAASKDVCGGLWDVAVAEHVQPGEALADAAARGVREELGVDVRADELQLLKPPRLHEVHAPPRHDREFNATFRLTRRLERAQLTVDPLEVAAVRFVSRANLHAEVQARPADWTPWFLADYALLHPQGQL